MSEAENKAKELIEKFTKYFDNKNKFSPYDKDRECSNAKNNSENAKQCALICVDEILENTLYLTLQSKNHNTYKFWQEVKQILETKQID